MTRSSASRDTRFRFPTRATRRFTRVPETAGASKWVVHVRCSWTKIGATSRGCRPASRFQSETKIKTPGCRFPCAGARRSPRWCQRGGRPGVATQRDHRRQWASSSEQPSPTTTRGRFARVRLIGQVAIRAARHASEVCDAGGRRRHWLPTARRGSVVVSGGEIPRR